MHHLLKRHRGLARAALAGSLTVGFSFCPAALQAAPVCALGTIPCFVFCGHPPRISTSDQAIRELRNSNYDALTRFDEISPLVTTPLGKCLGINGWRKYDLRPTVVGVVQQIATSWDGLQTVDMLLEDFDDQAGTQLSKGPTYIRAEIVRRVWKHLPEKLKEGDHVRVKGQLHWDGHGFLEVHPSREGDVSIAAASAHSVSLTYESRL